MTLHIPFDNSYARLPDRFFTHQPPTPVTAPALIRLNDGLARELGLDPDALRSPEGVAMLAGNAVPEGAAPLAQAYAGHQFGGWVPQLGDGRALLLGELDTPQGRFDLQLKGSGPTPYSRSGDGRAWLGPVLREYLVSEAMHALGIPTTRALAAVSTGEMVRRERNLPGAVLTRIARSHIRVGTFQYFAARQDGEALQALTDHVIARHYPQAESPLDLLNAVVEAQATLIAGWISVGFIHGVMNTDNVSVAGETIDYGPCAFMDAYNLDRVYSSIDQFGRYAFARQPEIAAWNLAQFATCLLPLMGERDAAIEAATEAVQRFPTAFAAHWLARFRAKLGLVSAEEGDADLIQALLDRMGDQKADFTKTFRGLADGSAAAQFSDPDAFAPWAEVWQARLAQDDQTPDQRRSLMERANPAIIPRNHRVEEAIQAALTGDFSPFHRLADALRTPFDDHGDLAEPPAPEQEVRQTFCGT